jgi:hypothetical protein
MWDASLSGPCGTDEDEGWGGGGGIHFIHIDPRPIARAERERREAEIAALLAAAWRAGESNEQAGQSYPKYVKVVDDYYSCWGMVVQRNVSYQVYDSENRPLGSGVITEHLFPLDYDSAIITRPSINSSSGLNTGIFNDEISIQLGSPRTYLQNFTVRGSSAGLAGFVDIPVYVQGFGGSCGVLNITKTATYVEINGNRGTPKPCN